MCITLARPRCSQPSVPESGALAFSLLLKQPSILLPQGLCFSTMMCLITLLKCLSPLPAPQAKPSTLCPLLLLYSAPKPCYLTYYIFLLTYFVHCLFPQLKLNKNKEFSLFSSLLYLPPMPRAMPCMYSVTMEWMDSEGYRNT